MNNDTYKLVGVANMWKIYPEFCWCIFEKDGKEYCQDCRINKNIIDSFELVRFHPDLKTYIDKEKFQLLGIKEEYKVGDNFVLALQLDKDKYIIGDIKEMVVFLKTYDPEPTILKNNLMGIDNNMHLKLLLRDIKEFIDNYPVPMKEEIRVLTKRKSN